MKQALNTLFITTPGTWLSLRNNNVVVKIDGVEKNAVNIGILESILCFGQVNATFPLMGYCAEHGVNFAFFGENGKFLGRVQGPVHGNVLLRRGQYRIADDDAQAASIVRCVLLGKLANTKAALRRFMRDHPPEGAAGEKFHAAVSTVEALAAQIKGSRDTDEMRGFEGTAARAYFDVFDGMILHQKEGFKFAGRTKRPPLDAVNAMLSFVYALLANDAEAALEGVGLDPAVGFLHKDRSGRSSLALDLMEEFRPWLADRFVLSMINKQQVKPENFRTTESGAVTMDDGARKKILAEWHDRKQDEITHPYTGEKMPLGMVPHMQAMLLARRIRGDMKEYPPFVWK